MTGVGSRRVGAHAAALVFVGLAAVLWLHPQSALYPGCPIYLMFHIRCPGCGATRAMAALLHGHLEEALRWNALFVVALPFLMMYVGVVYRRLLGEADFRWPQCKPVGIFGCVAVVLSFAVARDLLSF